MKSWIMEPETLRAELNNVLSIPRQWDSIERQWNDLSSLIRGYEGQISRITDAYQLGAIELDDLKRRIDMLKAKKSDAVKRRDEITALRQREIKQDGLRKTFQRVFADLPQSAKLSLSGEFLLETYTFRSMGTQPKLGEGTLGLRHRSMALRCLNDLFVAPESRGGKLMDAVIESI